MYLRSVTVTVGRLRIAYNLPLCAAFLTAVDSFVCFFNQPSVLFQRSLLGLFLIPTLLSYFYFGILNLKRYRGDTKNLKITFTRTLLNSYINNLMMINY